MPIAAVWSSIIVKLYGVIYIIISPERLIVRNVGTTRKFDDVPLIAYTAEQPGRTPSRLITAVGHESTYAAEVTPGGILCHPFYHPRILVPDYAPAEAILDFAVRSIYGNFWDFNLKQTFKPFLIIHSTVQYDGGLTPLEFKTLFELGMNLRTTRTYIWTGKRQLTDDEILSGQFPYNAWQGKAPWWQQTSLQKIN